MINPYDPPNSDEAADRYAVSVPLWALRAFGIIPVAIIVTSVVEKILFPTIGWRVDEWFHAIVPPATLAGAWLFALYSYKHSSRASLTFLAVFLFPLVLYSLPIWSTASQIFFFLMAGGSERFGLNTTFRMTAVLIPLWLVATVSSTLYFCYVILAILRPRK